MKKQIKDLESLEFDEFAESEVLHSDTREEIDHIENHSVDAIITSPPYPNEKDYSRTTRLESVLLNFITNRKELQTFKKALIRSNTRGVYVKDNDEKWIENFNSNTKYSKSD